MLTKLTKASEKVFNAVAVFSTVAAFSAGRLVFVMRVFLLRLHPDFLVLDSLVPAESSHPIALSLRKEKAVMLRRLAVFPLFEKQNTLLLQNRREQIVVPILQPNVLCVGMVVSRKRRAALREWGPIWNTTPFFLSGF